jgi:hypothetical protein
MIPAGLDTIFYFSHEIFENRPKQALFFQQSHCLEMASAIQ